MWYSASVLPISLSIFVAQNTSGMNLFVFRIDKTIGHVIYAHNLW